MYLTPLQTNLILLFKNEFIIPKSKEDILEHIKRFDQDIDKVEFLLKKYNGFATNIYSIFKDMTDEEADVIIKNLR